MSLQRKENNLRKAQARFDKVSKRSKQFQIDFRREENSRRYMTSIWADVISLLTNSTRFPVSLLLLLRVRST